MYFVVTWALKHFCTTFCLSDSHICMSVRQAIVSRFSQSQEPRRLPETIEFQINVVCSVRCYCICEHASIIKCLWLLYITIKLNCYNYNKTFIFCINLSWMFWRQGRFLLTEGAHISVALIQLALFQLNSFMLWTLTSLRVHMRPIVININLYAIWNKKKLYQHRIYKRYDLR